MSELESYGGVFDCQRFRDVMMYSVSVFSYGLPRAMEILADCIWRPKITQEEVWLIQIGRVQCTCKQLGYNNCRVIYI